MKTDELKALLFSKLISRGYNVQLNQSFYLTSKVRGYQRVVLDITYKSMDDTIKAIFYVGRIKDRKLIKHRMAHKKLFVLEKPEAMDDLLKEFIAWSLDNY